jgi:ankyrin repeat protein
MSDSFEPWLCRTMLQVAAYGGHTTVVASQIAAGVAVDETDERGKTALMFASVNGHLRSVQLLLKAGANVNRMHRVDSSTALLYATERGHAAVVGALLAAGARPNAMARDGLTPLTIACGMGFTAIVKMLLAAGANVNQPSLNHDSDETALYTPLMYASRVGCMIIMGMLLKAGATVNAVDRWGHTALTQPAHADTISFLTAAGADIRHTSAMDGSTVMHEAASDYAYSSQNFSYIDVIIAEGAEIDAVNTEGYTPLACAVSSGNTALVRKLLSLGASVNLGEQSPLLVALRSHYPEMVSLLLAAGADVNHRDGRGETPVQVAAARGRSDFVRLLLDAYADKDTVGANGQQTLLRAEQQQSGVTG